MNDSELGGHGLVDRLARDLRSAMWRLSAGAPQIAPTVAALALTLDEELTAHLAAEEETMFGPLERLRGFSERIRHLRREHEVLRLQSVGVRHLAARVAAGGSQAEEARALFLPMADSFLDTLHSHAALEDGEVLPAAEAVLGAERLAALTQEMIAAERRRLPAASLSLGNPPVQT